MILWHTKTRTFVKPGSFVSYAKCPPGTEEQGWLLIGWTPDRIIYLTKMGPQQLPVVNAVKDPRDFGCKWAK